MMGTGQPTPLTMLTTVLVTLAVAATLFAIYVYPAYAQEGSAPDKPTGLEATATHDSVTLTWDDPQDDSITGYVILRRIPGVDPQGQFSELVSNTGTDATTYTDDTVEADTDYTYRIKAINEHGVSERSRWFHINVPAAPEATEGDDPDGKGGGAPGGPGKRDNVSEPSDGDCPDGVTTTCEVDVGGSVTGNISTTTDVDWFKVVLETDKTYQIDMKGLDGGGGTIGDPYLHDIRDSSGTGISDTGNDDVDADNDIYDSQITFTATTAGAYYLVAAGAADSGTYTLSVREVETEEPACTLNEDDIWCGVVTVGDIEYNQALFARGFINVAGLSGGSFVGDTEIAVGSNTYTFTGIYVPVTGSFEDQLIFRMDADFTSGEKATLELYIDVDGAGSTWAMSDFADSTAEGQMIRAGEDFDWSSATTVTARLRPVTAAPAFSSSETFSAAENQTAAGTVLATDSDAGDDITGYAITGGADMALFEINETNGELTFKTAPDYEMPSDAGTDNDYVVEVTATSGTGERVKTATQTITVTVNNIGAPGKPAKPTVTAVPGVAELSVTWQEPDLNGGPAITGYNVDYRKEPHGSWTRSSYRGTAASTTITGLTAHTEYLVRVQATNAEGTGGWSDPSDAVSTEGPTCTLDPDDPGDVWCGVVTVGDTPFGYGYSVPFTHPNQSDQSTPQVGGLSDRDFMFREVPYTIDLIAVEPMGAAFFGGVYFSLTSRLTAEVKEDLTLYIGETSLNFKGARDAGGFTYLWPGDQQVEDFQVTLGPGQDWSMETEVELRLRVNAPPVFTSAAGFTVDENERSVGEVRATDDDPGDTYIRYEITGGADEELFEIDDESGALSFKSAPNYEDPQDEAANNTYEVEVEARSGDDQRAHSEDFITKRTRQTITVTVTDVDTEAPGQPGAPTVSSASATSLSVSWSAPDNAGPAITDYDYRYRTTSPEGAWTEVTGTTITTLSATIESLEETTLYDVQVRATNDEGTGDWSASGRGATDAAAVLPTLSIADAEGDEDDGVEFTATLTAGVSGKVMATWTASIQSDDTASAADLATTKTGEVEFDENATTAKFTVPVNDDTDIEGDETFTVTLSGVSSNAQLAADPTAKGTILNDDWPPLAWSTTLTVGNHFTTTHLYGYIWRATGSLTDQDFEFGSNSYEVTVVAVNTDGTVVFYLDRIGLPTEDFMTLEIGGHEFPFADRTSESTDAVWVWDAPADLLDPATNFPVGSTAIVCLRSEGQMCPTPAPPDSAPTFTSSATFDAAENQTVAGTVVAVDSDTGDDVTGYAITVRDITFGTDQGAFNIGVTDGVLTFKTAPNFEDPHDSDFENDYRVEVTATSGTGEREKTATQTITVTVTDVNTEAPGKPAAPTVSSASATSLTVSWSAPTNTGPAIDDYDVQYRAGTSGGWTDGNHTGTATMATLTGLSENTAYEVQVRATNDEGTGDWSDAGSGTTDANAAPAFSSAATFDAAENQTAAGTVVAADSNAEDSVTGYAITGGADQALFEIGATDGELTFKTAPNFEDPQDQDTNNAYVVEVTATSGAGTREKTATQTITVTVTDVNTEAPGQPGAPTVSAASATSLSVSWSAPDNAGPAITDYDYRHRTTSPEGSWTEVTGTTITTLSATIESLAESTSYDVQVRATNDEGTGDWSDAGSGTTDAAAVLPTLSIADAEGDEDEGVEFTATLTAGVSGKVTATWTASIESGDTASAADLATTKTGEVEFDENATEAKFTVPVNDDTTDEPDQTFTVTLSGVSSNAQLAADPTAEGTIDDDDPAPTLTVADVRHDESDSTAGVTVSLSELSEKRVRFRLRGLDRTGDTASDADWNQTGSTAFNIINAGTMSVTRVAIQVVNDTLDEDDETLTVEAYNLENAQGSSSDREATITIVDNDPTPTVTVADAAATEGDKVEFAVTLSAVSGRDVEVGYATSVATGDTAVSGTDFTAATGTLTILAADSTATGTVEVQTTEDDASESAETFTLTLSATTNVDLGTPSTAKGTINDDDAAAAPTITDVAVTSTPVLDTDTYGAGEEILFTVTFSEAVTVTGDPEFAFSLDSGEDRAPYKSGSGTTALIFAYTVAPGDEDDDGIFLFDGSDFNNRDGAVALDSDDAIQAASTTDADLAHTGRGTQSDHKVDGTRSIVSVEVTSTPMLETDTYGATETIQFTVTFTAAVDVTGDPVLEFLFDGSEVRQAGDVSGSGTTELVFGYTVVSGDDDDNGLFLRDESDYNNPDGPVRLDSDDEIEFKDTSTDVPLYWAGRGTQSGHKVDGSRTTGNVAPSFTTSATLSIPENTGRLTVEAVDSDTDDDITGYAITGGADQASFSSVSSLGELEFVNDPNFENPQDSGADNTYEVTVQATSGTGTREMTATRTFTVTVTDVNEQSAKPDKPTLAAVSGSSTSLTATWTKPGLNGGPDITGYGVRYKVSTESSWTVFAHTGTAVTATITGLTADTSYQVQVLAKNGETDSDWSEASDAVSTNAAAVLPTLSIGNASATEGSTIVFPLTLSAAASANVTVTCTASFESSDTAVAADLSSTTGAATIQAGATTGSCSIRTAQDTIDEDDETFTVTLSGVSSNAQLAADPTAKGTIVDDDTAPEVDDVAVTSTPVLETDTYGAGERIEVSVTFSEAVNATSDTDFVLSTGWGKQRMPLVDGSGTDTLVFGYTVAPGDEDDNGVFIGREEVTLVGDRDGNPQAGAITSVATGVPAHIDHVSESQPNHKVDGTRSIRSVEVISTPVLESDTYGAGETIRFRVTFNVAVDVDGDPVFTFALDGGESRSAAHETGGGTTALVFGYTVVSGDTDANGIFLWDEQDFDNPDGPVRLDSDDEIEFKDTSTDVPLYWQGRGTQSGHKVDGSRTTGNTAPYFTSLATFDAAENQTAAGTVVADDDDTDDSVTGYAITGGADQALFEIDAATGELTFKSAPNYEDPQDSGADNGYEVTVQATSGTGTREMTADQMITVEVKDADEQSAKPDKPTLAAVTGSTTSLTATWTKPDLNGGPDITGYALQYKVSTESSWTVFAHTGTAVTTTVTGLTADTSYQVQVLAKNGETDSDWSDPSDAVSTNPETATPTCTPNPGDIWCGVLTVGAVSTTLDGFTGPIGDLSDKTFSVDGRNYGIFQVSVANSTATNPGNLLFNLDRTLHAADKARLVLHVDGSSDTFAFSAIPGTGFTNQWTGTSLDWSSETFVTLRLRLAPAAPGKPRNLMAEADGGTRIDLSWDAPTDDGGSAIMGYRIEVSQDGSTGWSDLAADTGNDATSYTHEGLSPGDTRHYRVSAINAEGMSEASGVVNATTMREDPAADASLRALTVTHSGGSVALSPAFAPETVGYTASVANAVEEVTVAAEANASGATLAYLDGDDNALDDADAGTPGREVALEVGEETLVQVKVTAQNGDAMRTYRVTVTRRAVDAPGEEGEFRLTPDMQEDYEDPDNSRYAGKQSRLEVFHSNRWGTVCSDRFKGSDTDSHPSHGNLAPELSCRAMGYDDGEYASGYGTSEPHQSEADQDNYLRPGGTYPASGPLPIWLDDVMCWTRAEWPYGDDPTPDYGRLMYLENPDDPEDQAMTPYLCAYAGWGLHNGTHREDAGVRCWYDTEQSAQSSERALKGHFLLSPEQHDGSKRVKVTVAFSEPIDETPEGLRNHGVRVEGGEVTAVHREVGQPGAGTRSAGGPASGQVVWVIEIQPTSAEDLTLSLDGGRPCHEAGAICTADGRTLSKGISTTIKGPSSLTASFQDVPDTHDGETPFTFRVAFSEDIEIGLSALREDAFTVTGGTVTNGQRVDDRHDLFEVTVEPNSGGDVTITLPAGRDCSVSGAICTTGKNRRLLSNSPTAKVSGPANTPVTGAPTISGTAQVGETLTADISAIADADGLSGETFTYQWVSSDGTTGTDIENATASTYTLADADRGRFVRVRVTFTDDGGNEETLTSAPTGPVWADGPPGAPRNLAATAGNKEVSLSWESPEDNGNAPATRYRIEWRIDGKDYSRSQWRTSRSTTYATNDQANLANGVKYFFRVRAGNGSGNSQGPYGPSSGEVSATPTSGSAVDLGTPVLSNTETLHHGMVRLDWEDVEDAGWYVVQYYHVKDGEWLDLPAAGVDIALHGSSAVVSNLHGLSWLRVRAMSCAGASEWSQIEQLFGTNASDWDGVPVPEVEEGDEIEPCPVVLGTPVLSDTETLHHGMVQLDWEDVEDAGWYVVQYYHVKGGEWLDLPAAGVDIALHGSSAVVSNLHGLSWLRVRAMSCAGESEWSQIEQLFGTNASDWEGVPVPEVAEGDEIEPCSEDADTSDNSPATGAPTISGTAQVGETLEVDTSGVADADGFTNATFSYQWLADDADISGATGSTYTVAAADEGKAIKVVVSFTDDAGNDETLTSAATDAVAARPNSPATGGPTISGTAQVGETLTADTSDIADADGLRNVQYEYQWLADDAEIAGATGSTYTLVAEDEGKAIKVQVSFIDDEGNEETLTSAATAAVAAAPAPNSPATGAPTITGTAQVGETLTADMTSIADADGLDDVTFSYRWLSDGSEITGATAATYTLADSDEGKAIRVRVSFVDDEGNDETLTSAATAAVAAAEPSEPPDKPTGLEATAYHGQVVLTWKDPNDESITGYVILRRVRVNDQGGDFSVLVANTGSAATTYTDTTVAASTTYTYRIKAINQYGASERSRWVHIDTPAAP